MGTALKVMLGVILALIIVIAGCTALLAGGVSEVGKDEQEHAISESQYQQIETGMSRSQVEELLGPPASDQDMNVEGLNSQCIYYFEEGSDVQGVPSYQFCFDNDKLSSKSRY